MRRIAKTFSLLMIMVLLCGCSQKIVLTTGFKEGELFKVSGKPVKYDESVLILLNEKESYDEGLDSDFWNIEYDGATMFEHFKDKVKKQLSKLTILSEYSKNSGISLTEDENEIIENAAGKYIESLEPEAVEKYAVKKANVISLYEKIYLSKKIYDKSMRDFDGEVSDEEARVMYVNYIKIADKTFDKEQLIGDISAEIKEGMDFSSVPDKYADAEFYDGYITRQDFKKDKSDVIYTMKNGEISDVIDNEGDLYIIKCINDYDEDMTKSNKNILIEKLKNEQFYKAYEPYENKQNIEFNNKLWNDISIDDYTVQTNVNIYEILESEIDK